MTKRREKIRTGSIFGAWELVGSSELGHGGNSIVWQGQDRNGRQAALKFLNASLISAPDTFANRRVQRFVDEILFLRDNSNRPGILPRLDDNYSGFVTADARTWLATSLAKPSSKVFAPPGINLQQLVGFLLSIAEHLALLHVDGISHRDIKPDNLFMLDNAAVMGDFGLVEYPGKQDLTVQGEALGPGSLIAPEMISMSHVAKAGPADVYSLAKTLWILATGQRYAPSGQIRQEDQNLRLSEYNSHDRAAILEVIIEHATAYPPSTRPTMTDFATELQAWANPAVRVDARVDLAAMKAKLRPHVERGKTSQASHDRIVSQFQELVVRIHTLNDSVVGTIAETLGMTLNPSELTNQYNRILRHLRLTSLLFEAPFDLELRIPTSNPQHPLILTAGGIVSADACGAARLHFAVIAEQSRVGDGPVPSHAVHAWEGHASFLLGSAQGDLEFTRVANAYTGSVPNVLAAILRLLEQGHLDAKITQI